MGTKANPGEFDVDLAKLDPSEPFFVIRGEDPDAPSTVRRWSAAFAARIRREFARGELSERGYRAKLRKVHEALDCAVEMEIWRRENAE